ncbi:hypothetical protein BKA69DRAFT_1031349 [Paraphysoderma sedebokerense]|nr:hypothetical protein BKA69DRAFT_1031349 [Paraphysoderma sedebokerense]
MTPSPPPADVGKLQTEQHILKLLSKTFASVFSDRDYSTKLQRIKSLFYNRQYLEVFSNPEHLPIYCSRYISSRSLAYFDLFTSSPLLLELLKNDVDIVAVGAGAGSELVAVEFARYSCITNVDKRIQTNDPEKKLGVSKMHVIDIGNYEYIISSLQSTFKSLHPFHELLETNFSICDILDPTCLSSILASLSLPPPLLVTFAFVLSELLATSKSSTMSMISTLVAALPVGSYILLLDSAGSFSEITIGKNKYMIWMLFDMIKCLDVVEKSESRWYRVPEGLDYPVKMENMRYFYRIYRKIK